MYCIYHVSHDQSIEHTLTNKLTVTVLIYKPSRSPIIMQGPTFQMKLICENINF